LALGGAAHAGEICLVPSALNNRSVTVACGGTGYANEQIGYRTDGTATCKDFFCVVHPAFGWTVSASATDPFVNSGPLAPGASLYLWLYCNSTLTSGMAAAEFDLLATDLIVTGFVPLNGFLSAGSGANILIAVAGCPSGPVVAGRIDVQAAVGVAPVSWGRIKGDYR
jgi:hypothetical protein